MKRKNKSSIGKVIKILIFLIIVGVILALVYFNFIKKSDDNEVKVLKKISGYGYSLHDNETDLYKETFNELDKVLSKKTVDYEEYSKLVAKLFIIDFYTLNNKLSKNDIGGTDFIEEGFRENFVEQARSTFYRYIEVKSSNRTQKLPEVNKIDSVSSEKTSFEYKDNTVDDDAYKVTISWNYVKDLGYEKEAKMIMVKKDKKLYIVEMN